MQVKTLVNSMLASENAGEVLRACFTTGALGRILPEVAVLYGVPQPEEHHPEIDTGVHIELCVEEARKVAVGLPEHKAFALMYAVLLHDVGKGLTHEHWPKHPSHESLGVPLVEVINARSEVDELSAALALLVCKRHLQVHTVFGMNDKGVARLCYNVSSTLIELLVLACSCDARGRAGLQQVEYPQAGFLDSVRNQLCFESCYPEDKEDLSTQEGQELHRKRLGIISLIRKGFKND